MDERPEERIPEPVMAKLLKLRPILERTGGCIRPKKTGGKYRLRIRVPDPERGRVKKSVTLGDGRVAVAVMELIRGWQLAHAAAERHAENRPPDYEQQYAARVKSLREGILEGVPEGPMRRLYERELDREARDPRTLYGWLLAGPHSHPLVRRPGRKPKGGLA